MTPEQLHTIEYTHGPATYPVNGIIRCCTCAQAWPCDANRLAVEWRAAQALISFPDRAYYLRTDDGDYYPAKPFEGWPADGLWWVEGAQNDSGRTWAVRQSRISELPRALALTRGTLERYRERLIVAVQAVYQRRQTNAVAGIVWWPSPDAFAQAMLDALAEGIGTEGDDQ